MDESFFDHIDGLLDFPSEDITDPVFPPAGNSDSVLPSIWSESLPVSSGATATATAAACDLSAELSIPYEDIVQLEWLSTFVEDSFSDGGLAFPAADTGILPKNDDPRPFQTSSPVSVLESSSSSNSTNASLCSGEKISPCCPDAVIPRKYGRARSKRPRPASFSPRPAMIQLVSLLPQCSVPENYHNVPVKIRCESSESFTGPYSSAIDILKGAVAVPPTTPKKNKKKIEPTLPPRPMMAAMVEEEDPESVQAPIRKCLHCHITKTPQWRAGPLGPKTLCNACGVRFKSGRLFPEYRPAASPTFVPSLHSNSHKKVLEMRSKTGGLIIRDVPPELIPNTSAFVQMDCM